MCPFCPQLKHIMSSIHSKLATCPCGNPQYVGIQLLPTSIGTGWLFIQGGTFEELYYLGEPCCPQLPGPFCWLKKGCHCPFPCWNPQNALPWNPHPPEFCDHNMLSRSTLDLVQSIAFCLISWYVVTCRGLKTSSITNCVSPSSYTLAQSSFCVS
jgi:hypothetical protein